MNKKVNKKMFSVVRLCRQDIIDAGFSEKDVMSLTDGDMEYIASRIADGINVYSPLYERLNKLRVWVRKNVKDNKK